MSLLSQISSCLPVSLVSVTDRACLRVRRSPETSPLRPDSAYFTTSASKAKFLAQYGRDVSADQSLKHVHNVEEVKRQKVRTRSGTPGDGTRDTECGWSVMLTVC